ncbi:MAG: hypothetical protein GC185_12295 [Alphaproteobacteria bacterium]|nr:hypothetical protein [Alphaproteobacteria bacterium]
MNKSKEESIADAWIRFAKRLLNLAERICQEIVLPPTIRPSDPKVAALLLVKRSISNGKSAILLHRRNLIIDARIIVRTSLENAFWIAGLTDHGKDFVKKMADHDLKYKKLLGERVLAYQSYRGSEPNISLQETIRVIGNEKRKAMTPKNVAEESALKHFYILYQLLSSDSAHPTTEALSRFLSPPEKKTGMRTLNATATLKPNEVSDTIWYLCLALLAICVGANQLWGGTKAGKHLSRLEKDYQTLYKKYVSGRS